MREAGSPATMRLGQVCWEDFPEVTVLDLSSDIEDSEEKVSLIITARQKRVLGNSGGNFSEVTEFDREDVLGSQGGSLQAPHEQGLKRSGRLMETLIAEKSEERNTTAIMVLYGCHV